ncbi:hypothetical protein H8356DRAFT_1326902 [Neocallimastix lanati (nom. inval.)]|nr:hypothetical protein H8356DRAFT_1326902 [Neocallimastix sp. JGI-2020a]
MRRGGVLHYVYTYRRSLLIISAYSPVLILILQSVNSYCNNTLVLRVRDSYYKYQSIKRTEAPACPLAQASCTTRTSDSSTRFIRL